MIIIALIFIAVGIIVKHGKMYSLMAGYNTMTIEEKAKIDSAGLATLFRNVMFAMAIGLTAGYFLEMWLSNPDIEFYTFFGVIVTGTIYLIVKGNSDKYRLDNKKQ
ncbi:DUF3784 domain-containing protein [Flavobacterium cerinum]|uniref:DUF3784 domain-containing protein n=1 Tax=Flavobacterium cerinum TaxID=2502784 RepID=A0A444HDY5_9FLAO|nr:DUF3784 domain-containing protein [Flavobacterium cerinum]RWX02433.1 DUF3784 domain-containing protein [Flavobacterium cerinum]